MNSTNNNVYNMEGEYRIMNREIEAKTAEYLKKADEIVKNQEESLEKIINNATPNENACGDSVKFNEINYSQMSDTDTPRSDSDDLYTQRLSRASNSSLKEERNRFFAKVENYSQQSNRISCETTKPTSKIEREFLIINTLKNKIKTIQGDSIKKDEQIKKKSAENESIKKANQRLHEDKLKLCFQINSLKAQSTKFDSKVANLGDKLKAKEVEYHSLCAENEALNKVAKDTKQNVSRLEVRLTRALEDVAMVTEQLTVARISKREVVDSSKKRIAELTTDLEKFKRKNQNMIISLVKQAQLVDNLKRQVVFLKTGKEVKNVDEKFDSLLQWNV